MGCGQELVGLRSEVRFRSERRTLLEVLFLGLAAHTRHAGHGLDVTLTHGRWMEDGFGGPRQAHRQPCRAQQDPGHPWGRSHGS